MKKYQYTKESIIDAVKLSSNFTELFRNLNFPTNGSLFTEIKKFVIENEIDTSHFTGPAWNKGKTLMEDSRLSKKSVSDIFIENSKFSKPYVRSLVRRKNLIDYKCKKCENSGRWMENNLCLQLDHINGIPNDQRLENLRWLCPNCHSQTSTYCSKNISKNKKKITDLEILNALDKYKTIHSALDSLGIANGRNYSRVYRLIGSCSPTGRRQ